MKIYHDYEFVDREGRSEPYYQLVQLSMWNFGVNPICFNRSIHLGGTPHIFRYALGYYTRRDSGYFKADFIEDTTDEMEQELERMGYTLKTKLKTQ